MSQLHRFFNIFLRVVWCNTLALFSWLFNSQRCCYLHRAQACQATTLSPIICPTCHCCQTPATRHSLVSVSGRRCRVISQCLTRHRVADTSTHLTQHQTCKVINYRLLRIPGTKVSQGYSLKFSCEGFNQVNM